MWGPSVTLSKNLAALSDKGNFDGLYLPGRYSSEKGNVSEDKMFDYFLFDTESAKDLGMYPFKNHGTESSESKRNLFSGGLVDEFHNHGRGLSSYSKRVLKRAILLPERTAEAISQRQNVFRAFENHSNLRNIESLYSGSFIRDPSRGDGGEHLVDYLLDRFFSDYRDVSSRYVALKALTAFRNLAGIAQEASKISFLGDFSKHLQRTLGPISRLNSFLLAEDHTIQFSGDLKSAGIGWVLKEPQNPYRVVDFSEELGKQSILQGNLRGSIAEGLVRDYLSLPEKHGFLENVALLEVCMGYARFRESGRNEWCIPEMVDSEEPFVEIEGYVHPTYLRESKKGGTLRIGGDDLINVITGANDSGKTQSIRGLAQLVTLAHAGFPIPAKSARMSVLSNIQTNFGGKDDSTKGRYKKALSRWMHIFKHLDRSLILGDEPTDGTFPDTGVEHGIRALKTFERRNIPVVLTTHYHDIARAVDSGEIPRSRNLHVDVNVNPDKTVSSTYQISDDPDYKSYGEEVAVDVGFTEENLDLIAEGRQPRIEFDEYELPF